MRCTDGARAARKTFVVPKYPRHAGCYSLRNKMRIVVISPFPAERIALQALLADDGHDITSVATRTEGMSLALAEHPEVIIADAQVVGNDCLALIQELANRGVTPRVIFVCPRASRGRHGVICLTKPIDLAELRRHIAPRQHFVPRVA